MYGVQEPVEYAELWLVDEGPQSSRDNERHEGGQEESHSEHGGEADAGVDQSGEAQRYGRLEDGRHRAEFDRVYEGCPEDGVAEHRSKIGKAHKGRRAEPGPLSQADRHRPHQRVGDENAEESQRGEDEVIAHRPGPGITRGRHGGPCGPGVAAPSRAFHPAAARPAFWHLPAACRGGLHRGWQANCHGNHLALKRASARPRPRTGATLGTIWTGQKALTELRVEHTRRERHSYPVHFILRRSNAAGGLDLAFEFRRSSGGR